MIARRLNNTLLYLLLIVLALVVLYPLLFTVFSSFMTEQEVSKFPPALVPSQLYWGNFKAAIDNVPVFQFILNSFIVSSAIMVSQVITSAMAAYAFSFLNFTGKNALFMVFLATMMIPWEVTIIPNYLTIKSWGWMDSYPGLIVPFMAAAFGVFLLRQFFLQLPHELFDAAKIDGCGHWRNFFSIVLPLSKPALSTLAVYEFLTHWNSYLWPLLITNKVSMRTVQIGVAMLQHAEVMSWNMILAGITIVLLPSFLLLALGVKQLVRGITAGAVKG
ncbi:carbohydrate ABC transporter permease [Paenibacillus chitinolyticus]|uniref:Carbohydrate ABC transporter permease n=1 Tax=Paenibacillus chitinolyticus TaxID=79263 RepID=A0A410WPN0_9BACL|nr:MULTISPECIES: carbohydrate ABC transporter permease [Paenibacillus]MCY9590819.1 carbohydrate ABC transporter permease [Paenibacillus chitinolyticus]MCY9598726.1 carbohydrate ABC transporter permease [Paenibacillus chitinolyticus]MEC0245337.1 carbohydrate ABC transporter permease [Paenibacillus chitinolyticus]QAV16267.1 carbohydrate ABC transporter permease [Paenibacillus chitinolyticus]SEG28026.1 sn-glycerol 3-phosphate transport system permease protein [Paenibacillus sp. UNC499MF]